MNQKQIWNKNSQEDIIKNLINLLEKSVKKKIPKEKFGLLLSGGLDSSILAVLLKKLDCNFICYVVEFHHPSFKKADDIKYSKLIAKKLGLKLKIVKVNIKQVKAVLPKIINLIKTDNVPMVSIALAIYFCMKQASSEKVKTILYDCALDCVFAGLHKHRAVKNLKRACIESLEKTYKIDLPRDTKIAKHFKINLKSPFLDKELTSFALALPSKYKIHKGINKYILRKTALELGLPKSIALRKKRAIQYSSNSQKIIKKLAKQNNFKKMSDYLESLNHD